MALARTGNVDSNELYTFFTNDTNAFNNIVSISGQVAALTVGLGAASLVYSGIRGGSNPEITDFKVNEIINDLTRDQTAAQNIVNTLGVAAIISANYYILAQFGEPANRRRAGDLFTHMFITNRQGIGNPLDLVFGLLDGVLSYSAVLRTIVFYSLGAGGIIIFWLIMSLLPNNPPGRRKRSQGVRRHKVKKRNVLYDDSNIYRILSSVHENHFDMT